MNEDDLREAMRLRFTAISIREWCKVMNVAPSHVSEFLNGKRGPGNDLLQALNLEIRYVKKRRSKT